MVFCYLSTVFCYVSSLLLYVFCYLWYCNLQDELVSPERWDSRTISLLFTSDTIKALAELLDKVICFEECCYLGITREMGVPDIIGLHLSWEFTRGLEHQPVIKHFNLYLRTLDVVGSVAASIDCHLLNDKLRVVAFRHELGMLPQERMLANLSFDKLNCLLDLVQDGTLKCNILDDVHLSTHLFINTLVSDEASTGTGEELLGILAKEKNASGAHLFFTIDLQSSLLTLGRADAGIVLLSFNRSLLVGPHKTIVLSQVLQGTFLIADYFGIVGNSIESSMYCMHLYPSQRGQ